MAQNDLLYRIYIYTIQTVLYLIRIVSNTPAVIKRSTSLVINQDLNTPSISLIYTPNLRKSIVLGSFFSALMPSFTPFTCRQMSSLQVTRTLVEDD